MHKSEYEQTVDSGGHSIANDIPCFQCSHMIGCYWPARISWATQLTMKKHIGQTYGGQPYTNHLVTVVGLLLKYKAHPAIIAAGWLHDIVEDTQTSYFDVIRALGHPFEFGVTVAELVWAVTKNEGCGTPFHRIEQTAGALMLKLADRIANVEACKNSENPDTKEMRDRLLRKYRSEQGKFQLLQVNGQYDDMWQRLNSGLE